MALPLMVRLRESEQDDEESDAVEDVEVVRPLEEGEWVVSTVSLRFRCAMMDIRVWKWLGLFCLPSPAKVLDVTVAV